MMSAHSLSLSSNSEDVETAVIDYRYVKVKDRPRTIDR